MKHKEFEELIYLYIWDELEEDKKDLLLEHLIECEECSDVYKELKYVNEEIIISQQSKISELDLSNSRKKLFNTIESLTPKNETPITKSKFFTLPFIFESKKSFVVAVTIIIMFIWGYNYLSTKNGFEKNLFSDVIDLDKIEKGEIEFAQIRIPNRFEESKVFNFKFNNQDQVFQGQLSDITTQKLVSLALKGAENPGFKIKTLRLVNEYLEENSQEENQLVDALIYSLKNDSNAGVRKTALKGLLKFGYNKKIKNALLYTLSNDDNASIRIEAINALLDKKFAANDYQDNIEYKLEEIIPNETNELVKFRTIKYLMGDK